MKLINKNNNIIFVVEKHIINKHGINFNMEKKENKIIIINCRPHQTI